jgi:CheY-like chemotaxis protein
LTLPVHQKVETLEKGVEVSEESISLTGEVSSPASEKSPVVIFLSQDAFSARVFAEMMEGCKVTLMTDPAQLFTTVESSYPRAVVIDEPLLTNNDVRAFLAKPPFDVPVYSLPIPVSRQNRNSNLPDGVCDYLVKPVPREVMIETIARLEINPRTVLVVDDDPSMSHFVTQSLKTTVSDRIHLDEEIKILTALDGREAFRFLQAIPVGVVLLDLDLTDMNGLTLLNQMRQDSTLREIPVVIVSASDPPPSFTPKLVGEFRLIVHHTLTRKELVDLLTASLRQVVPTYTPLKTEGKHAKPEGFIKK